MKLGLFGKCRPAAAAVSVVIGTLFVSSCSTVSSRIEKNPATYQALSPADRDLVRSGRIREGLSRQAVYLAWGNPDRLREGSRKGQPYTSWIYTTLQSEYVGGFYPRFGPYGFYGYGYRGFHGFHHFGFYGYYDPFLLDDFYSVEIPYKVAFFEGDRCTGYEYLR